MRVTIVTGVSVMHAVAVDSSGNCALGRTRSATGRTDRHVLYNASSRALGERRDANPSARGARTMPASLISTANPVGVFGTDASGVTTIIWSTDSAQRGRVYLTVTKGGTVTVSDLLFSGNAAIGDTAGSKTLTVAFGSSYALTLRDAANNAVLATLTVTVQDIQPVLLAEALRWANLDKKFNPAQAIYNLKVNADIDTCRVRFKTTQPSVPSIAATDADGNVVASALPLFGGLRTEHDVLLGEMVPLPQATELTLKIVVSGHTMTGQPTQAQATSAFKTGSRHAVIDFQEIHVRLDGDPDGEGEFRWTFGAGDADTEAELGKPWPVFKKDMSDGNRAPIREQISIPFAPRRLWVLAFGQDDDTNAFDARGILGLRAPYYHGEGSGWITRPEEDTAWVERHFDISGVNEGALPIELSTGDFGVAFTIKGRIIISSVAARSPAFVSFPDFARGRIFQIDKPSTVSATFGTVWNQQPGEADQPRLGRTIARGPDGAVYRQTLDAAGRWRPDQGWMPAAPAVEGVVTVAATEDDRIALFTVDAKGAVLRADLGSRDDAGRWRSLGGRFAGTVGAVVRRKTIELVAHDGDGAVFHRTVTAEGERGADWQRIGTGVKGEPIAVALDAEAFAVFALGQSGEVLVKHHRDSRWQAKDWQVIAGVAGTRLGAAAIEGQGVALAVIDQDLKLHTLLARDERGVAPKAWTAQGDLQAWLTRPLEPPKTSLKARKLPDKKTAEKKPRTRIAA
jgi:hypothetical protein